MERGGEALEGGAEVDGGGVAEEVEEDKEAEQEDGVAEERAVAEGAVEELEVVNEAFRDAVGGVSLEVSANGYVVFELTQAMAVFFFFFFCSCCCCKKKQRNEEEKGSFHGDRSHGYNE